MANPKALTCRAAAQPGQRCPELATVPKGLQLCWVHQQALANRNRVRPLELVPMQLSELEQ